MKTAKTAAAKTAAVKTAYLKVHANAVMLDQGQQPWAIAFGVYVTKQDGTPVIGLTKDNFKVWELRLSVFEPLDVRLVTESASDVPGVYWVQTQPTPLFPGAPAPQQFLHAIRVALAEQVIEFEGAATTAVTYLGKYH